MKHRKKSLGITLIEVLIAIVLVGVISILSTYFISGFQLNSGAQYDTNMQAFSRSYLDDVRAYWSIPGNYTSNMLPINASGQAVTPPTGYTYKVEVRTAVPGVPSTSIRSLTYAPGTTVTPVNDASPTAVPLKRVVLTVTSPKGRTETFTLQIAAPAGGGS